MMRTILLSIAYDGANFSGLAVQVNAETVGGVLLKAIRRLDPGVKKLRVASRTDAGVHARDQRVAFDTTIDVPNRAWVRGLLPYLPRSVVITRASTVPLDFTPRFETIKKRYRYLLLAQYRSDPFMVHRSWRVGPVADDAVELMNEELHDIVGRHDFAGFASSRDQRTNTVRTMKRVDVRRMPSETPLIAIDIAGNGFLHNMVRIMVGTVVDVALGKLEPGAMRRGLASLDRNALGVTAPPDGLYLEELGLADEGVDAWPEHRLQHERAT